MKRGKANLEKLKTDRYFYEELCGARQAAYEYGLDGAQWIQDNFGISLGDFQAVAMKWSEVQAQDIHNNTENIHHFVDYQQRNKRNMQPNLPLNKVATLLMMWNSDRL